MITAERITKRKIRITEDIELSDDTIALLDPDRAFSIDGTMRISQILKAQVLISLNLIYVIEEGRYYKVTERGKAVFKAHKTL